MSSAPLVAFAGAAQLQTGQRLLRIAGVEQGTPRALQVTIGGYEASALPGELTDLTITPAAAGANPATADPATADAATPDAARGLRQWLLRAGERQFEISGRSIHVHRPAAEAFYAAVPGAPLTWQARAGWAVLLNLLRVPGMTRLLQFLRSR
jgi:hypothetical protein